LNSTQACKIYDVSRATLHRHRGTHDITYYTKKNGIPMYDPLELEKKYGLRRTDKEKQELMELQYENKLRQISHIDKIIAIHRVGSENERSLLEEYGKYFSKILHNPEIILYIEPDADKITDEISNLVYKCCTKQVNCIIFKGGNVFGKMIYNFIQKLALHNKVDFINLDDGKQLEEAKYKYYKSEKGIELETSKGSTFSSTLDSIKTRGIEFIM
jgi:hypothetical protein